MINISNQLTVVGGGMAGISAAISAARQGLKVALINNRPVLGGNHSSELRVHYNGSANSVSYYARESGLSDEIKLNIFKYNLRYNTKDDYEFTDMALLNMLYNEPNISLYLNTSVYDVNVANGKIIAVFARQLTTEKQFMFESSLFVDASGDGIVGYLAGALYRVGREAKSEYNESLAVKQADGCGMGSCILFKVGKENKPIPFVKPPFAYDYKKDDILKWVLRPETGRKFRENIEEVDGIWWLSYGGDMDVIKDNEEIALELNKLVYGYWDYVKNSGKYTGVENLYLKWVAPFPAKRESRKFIGEHILTQCDIENKADFEDAVSVGGWSLDIHDVEGVYGSGLTSQFGFVPGLYNIPFRIMYSKNIDNLMLTGRIVSCTHVALGSLRVMQTLAAMAQAVGTAAFLCDKYGIMPREIYEGNHIKELQEILQRDGQYIAGYREDVGLAKIAHITASSYKIMENTEVDIQIELDDNYCLAVPMNSPVIDSIEVKMKNLTNEKQMLKILVLGGNMIGNYSTEYEIKRMEIPVGENFDGWQTLPLHCERSKDMKNYIVIMKNPFIQIFASEERITGAPSFKYNEATGKIQRLKTKLPLNDEKYLCIGFRNIMPKQNSYCPENVINGYSRPYGLPNVWVSKEEDESLLELKFDLPKDIKEIQIIFNTQLETNNFSSPIKQLIKTYAMEIFTKNGQVLRREKKDNYLGLNRYFEDVKNVTKIRFTFNETYGSHFFEVFAVKVF
ncbi:FAD-dependent oxidoreductase [Clostridium sp.]